MGPLEDAFGSGGAEKGREAIGFLSGEFAAGGGEAVIAATVVVRIDFLYEFFFEEGFDGAVEGSGAKSDGSAGLFFDLAHDAVAVEVVASERKEDVEGGRGERVELAARHNRGTIYRLTSIAVRSGF